MTNDKQTAIGFINLNKPVDFTSHDCVAKVRRLLKLKKVGHGGTLDPLATGVLPIAVGKATRLLQFLPEGKAYRARIRLGVQTTTDDLEGEILSQQPASQLTVEQVRAILPQFIGQIEQIPPAYSAIQRDGKRLYELARKGKKVDVPSRRVEVNDMEILGWHPGEFPEVEVAIACGGGTYIRAIARDLGTILQTGGTLAALIRTQSCGLQLSNSVTFEQLEMQCQQGNFQPIPPDTLLEHYDAIALPPQDARRWCQGQRISTEAVNDSIVRVYREGGGFLGIGTREASQNQWELIPKIVF
ncbi:MAG: tRNA pseudouridine(55) synthase TruB [Cyanobacteriota bacterium]|nr:tRNA pseudouridine(55) synthase TruB [Cyanobacteriota bacterium]